MGAVLGDERHLIARYVLLGKNGTDRTGRDARATVDALVRVNVKLIVALVNALDGTDIDTCGIFGANAGLRNDECHVAHLLGSLKPVWVLGKMWVLPIEQHHLNGESSGRVEIVRYIRWRILKDRSGQWSVRAIWWLVLKAVLPVHFVMQSAVQPDAVLSDAKFFPEQVWRIWLEGTEV
jgi:hypothetical protein